jgi:hypothetical protein
MTTLYLIADSIGHPVKQSAPVSVPLIVIEMASSPPVEQVMDVSATQRMADESRIRHFTVIRSDSTS